MNTTVLHLADWFQALHLLPQMVLVEGASTISVTSSGIGELDACPVQTEPDSHRVAVVARTVLT